MRFKALRIFVGVTLITVASAIMVIQSGFFAGILKNIIVRYVPSSLGLNLDFKDLNVLFFPPGVIVNRPKFTLKKENAFSLPESSSLEFERMEITFQFFQLISGSININALNIIGADLNLTVEKELIDALQSSSSNAKKNSSRKSWWDALINVNFRSVGIIDSKVNLQFESLIGGKPVRVSGNAKEITISRGTRDELPSYDLSVEITNAQLQTEKYHHNLSTMRASIEVFEKGVQIRSVSLQEGEITLHCGGIIKGNITNPKTLPADLDLLIMGPLQQWVQDAVIGAHIKIPHRDTFSGYIKMEAHLTGDLLNVFDTYEIRSNIQLKDFTYDRWVAREGTVAFRSKKNLLELEQLSLKLTDGSIKASKASFNLSKAPYLQSAIINLENIDIRQILGRATDYIHPVHLKASGSVTITADKDLPDTIRITPDVVVKNFILDNQSLKEKRKYKKIIELNQGKIIDGTVIVDPRKIQFQGIKAHLDRSQLGMDGIINFNEGYNLHIGGKVDLQDLVHIADAPIRGKGSLKWSISGPAHNILMNYDFSLSDANFLNFPLGDAEGRISYHDGKDYLAVDSVKAGLGNMEIAATGGVWFKGPQEAVQLKLSVPKGTCTDFNVVMSYYLKKISWYPYQVTCDMKGDVTVSGKPDENELIIEADTHLRNVDYYGEIFNEATLLVGMKKGNFFADRIQLRKKSGLIKGSVSYSQDDELRLDLNTESMTTNDIDLLSRLDFAYNAPIYAKARMQGKWGRLEGNASFALGYGNIKTATVPPSEVVIQALNSKYLMNMNIMGGQAIAQSEWGQQGPSDGKLTIDVPKLDLIPFIAAVNPQIIEDPVASGTLSASMNVRFNTNHFSKMSGRVSVNQFKIQKRGSKLQLLSPVEFSLDQGDYNFGRVRLIGDGTELSVTGSVNSGRIQYDATGDLPLSLFEFLTPEIPVFRGAVHLQASVTGKADAPDFVARGTINGADLRVAKIEQYFEGITGLIQWKNEELLFSDLSARFGGGTVTGKGRALLRLTKSPALDFTFSLKNPKFKIYPFSYVRLNGIMNVKADTMPYLASGNLAIAEALVQQNFSSADGKASRSSAFFPKAGSENQDRLYLFEMDFNVEGEKDIYVKNDLFDTQLKGKLRVFGTAESPKLLGNLEVIQGKIFFNENAFIINTGLVKFNNPSMIDPEFDMTANIDHKGYKVNLYASGKPSDPKISFKSQPPLSQQDIITLLTLGMTSSGYQSMRSQDRDAYSRDEVYSLLFSQSGVSKGLKNKYGINVGVDQAVNANIAESAFRRNTDTNLNVAPKVVLQKEIVKNLSAKVGSTVGVGDSRQQDLNLEYQFGRNASVQGVYEDQRGSTPRNSRTSMGLDLKFRWNFK